MTTPPPDTETKAAMKTTLVVSTTWSASHQLDRTFGTRRKHAQHKCARLHGHGYKMEVHVTGPVNSLGIVADFAHIKEVVRRIVHFRFDHKHLNDDDWFADVDPTAEVVAAKSLEALRSSLPGVTKVVLWETESGRVEVEA